MATAEITPPLPPGFVLEGSDTPPLPDGFILEETAVPPLPEGFVLESEAATSSQGMGDLKSAEQTLDFQPDETAINEQLVQGLFGAPSMPISERQKQVEELQQSEAYQGVQAASGLSNAVMEAGRDENVTLPLSQGVDLGLKRNIELFNEGTPIPSPTGDGLLASIGRPIVGAANAMGTTENLALMMSFEGAPLVVQRAAGALFGGMMAKDAGDQLAVALDENLTPSQRIEAGTQAAIDSAMAVLGFSAAGTRGLKGGAAPERRTATAETAPIADAAGFVNREAPSPIPERIALPESSAAPPKVADHLTTPKEVTEIIDETPAAPSMKSGEIPPEGGAALGTGGTRPSTTPIGNTPRGDSNWIRIPNALKRIGKGLFTEGVGPVLKRQKNQVAQALSKAVRRHVDIEQELYGSQEATLRKAVNSIPKPRQEAAFTEAAQYFREVENGRPAPTLQPDAKALVDAWYKVGRDTGDISRANGVQVFDSSINGYRPMRTVKDYVPRMFKGEVESALRDPESNPTLWNQLVNDLAAQRGTTPELAAKELQSTAGRFSSSDFMGNLELARQEQMPESFYEYDLRNLASRYLPSFSERMAQIIAFGQRLGPRESPIKGNLWDAAKKESRDTRTQEWLTTAEDQSTGFKAKNSFQRSAGRLQTLASAGLLSNPTSTVVRNMLSGLSMTAERFGVGRSLKQLRYAADAAQQMTAREIGAIRDDIGNVLHADTMGDSKLDNFIRSVTQGAFKYSGFTPSESFVRTHNALTANAFVRDAAAALASNPRSALSREALAMFKRFGVDAEKVVAENGNWQTGPETRKFIRTAVRESQGGYRYDQVPLWANSNAGRFFYQYGRWGVQRAHDIFENTIKPAIGEDVEFRGQRMTRRNVAPLIRLGIGTVALGETFGAINSLLFNRDRRDASMNEIGEAWKEDEKRAVEMAFERVTNDIIMAGSLGLLGQPIDFIKTAKDASRLKNPAEPPSLNSVKALADLTKKAMDQGGSLTKRDLLDFASSVAPGPKGVYQVGQNIFGDDVYQAKNDQRTLRNAAKRWAESKGLDVKSRMEFGSMGKSKNAPTFEALNDALLSRNVEEAVSIRDAYIAKAPDKNAARKSLESSVTSRHPFKAGLLSSDKYQKEFEQWADKNLSEGDREQIRRVIDTYEKTAQEAGLN